jgi:hypothetical protein
MRHLLSLDQVIEAMNEAKPISHAGEWLRIRRRYRALRFQPFVDQNGSRSAQDCGSALAFGASRSRKAFVITDRELRLIAAAAIIGESSQPVTG